MTKSWLPLWVSRIEVVHGEMLFRMMQGGAEPAELWLQKIEMAVEKLGTRRQLMQGRPATVSLHAALGRSGDLTAFALARSALSFAGEVALRDFRAEELYDFVAPKTGIRAMEPWT